MLKLLTRIKKSISLFTYKDKLNRICNRCGAMQRKYHEWQWFSTWWEEYPYKMKDRNCKCHRYHTQR